MELWRERLMLRTQDLPLVRSHTKSFSDGRENFVRPQTRAVVIHCRGYKHFIHAAIHLLPVSVSALPPQKARRSGLITSAFAVNMPCEDFS